MVVSAESLERAVSADRSGIASTSAAHTKVSGDTIVQSTRDEVSSEMAPAFRVSSQHAASAQSVPT